MSIVKYSDLLGEVLPHLAGGPSDPMAEAAIRNAAIEFCNQSWIWRYLPDAIDIVAGEGAYDLEPEFGADVAAVLSCAVDGGALTAASTDDLDRMDARWQTLSGSARYYTQTDTASILMVPRPERDIAGGLVIVLALQPRRSAAAFPAWIADQYAESIAAGALSRLMLMPGREWADAQAGAIHMAHFKSAISGARTTAVGGLSRATTRTTSHH